MIKPSIGRVVWFWPDASQLHCMSTFDRNQPMAAQIVCVWGDRLVNLVVWDHAGAQHPVTSVALLQDDDPKPAFQHCEWMPFQRAQAQSFQHQQIERQGSNA